MSVDLEIKWCPCQGQSMEKANWGAASTFQNFCNKPLQSNYEFFDSIFETKLIYQS